MKLTGPLPLLAVHAGLMKTKTVHVVLKEGPNAVKTSLIDVWRAGTLRPVKHVSRVIVKQNGHIIFYVARSSHAQYLAYTNNISSFHFNTFLERPLVDKYCSYHYPLWFNQNNHFPIKQQL